MAKARNFLSVLNPFTGSAPKDPTVNLTNAIAKVQLQRLRHDVKMWREAVGEAELAFYPHRVKMQRMYLDTKLNGHVLACMDRRKDLTLLRDFEVLDSQGNEIEGLEYIFKSEWFNLFMEYVLDAKFFGYSLISLGDIEDGKFKELTYIPREHISPDRLQVTRFVYAPNGIDFTQEPYSDWHIYVKTPTDNGKSPCGYGLLYNVAIYEIFMRNVLGYNGDFIELYAQPYRVGKTTKTDETERSLFEAALRDMGSAGYAVVDPTDEINFIETQLGGTGWKGYENLEQRCQKIISKLILGHADAMDSIPGKLGGGQGEESPVYQALEDKQARDARFVEAVVNDELIPRMRNLGFKIPDDITFCFSNNNELDEKLNRENEVSKQVADIALTMHNAGLKMGAEYFTERTGIPAEEVTPAPFGFNNRIQAKLNSIYK